MPFKKRSKRHDDDSSSDYSDTDDESIGNRKDQRYEKEIERLEKDNEFLEMENDRLKRKSISSEADHPQSESTGFLSFGVRKDEVWSKVNEVPYKRNKSTFFKFTSPESESHGDCYGCLMRSEESSRASSTKRAKKTVYCLSSIVHYILSETTEEDTPNTVTDTDEYESTSPSSSVQDKINFCKSCLNSQYFSAIQKYVSSPLHPFDSLSKSKEFVVQERSVLLQLCGSDAFFLEKIKKILDLIHMKNRKLMYLRQEDVGGEQEEKEVVVLHSFSSTVRTIDYRSGIYIGDVKISTLGENEVVIPDGKGTFHKNLDKLSKKPAVSYTGSWTNGLYHGYGELSCGKITYFGYFQNGVKHDRRAKVLFSGIEVFSGGFENDLRHGLGTSTSLCGKRKIHGSYHSGQKHGFFRSVHVSDGIEYTVQEMYRNNSLVNVENTVITYPQKKYTGSTSRGYPVLPHGKGTMMNQESGCTYTGSWESGKEHGRGRMEDEYKIYFGIWKEGCKEGMFEVVDKQSGEKEEVCFIKDRCINMSSEDCCFLEKEFWFEITVLSREKSCSSYSSLVTYKNIEKSFKGLYKGECKILKGSLTPHGKGSLHCFHRGIFTGDWYEGMIHGKGNFVSCGDTLGADVLEYTGEYSFGTMKGEGLLKYKNGSIFEGTMMDNSPKEGILNYSFCSFHPLNAKLKDIHDIDAQKRVDAKFSAIKVAYEEKVLQGYTKEFDVERALWRAEQERLPPRISYYKGEFEFHEFHGKGVIYDSWNNVVEEGDYDYGKLVNENLVLNDSDENYIF
jgi:hypothetical protein